mmetsp:Transcript_38474/g.47666  ORF Transcript_38474/g.47666 Transcript_38474/m.47666 type:complete len:114 (-) Transcript_38474:893-1234(-)
MCSMPLQRSPWAMQSCLHSANELTLATVKCVAALSVGVLPRQTRSTPPSTGSKRSAEVVVPGVVETVVAMGVVVVDVVVVVVVVVVELAPVVATMDFHLPLQLPSQFDFDWSQ